MKASRPSALTDRSYRFLEALENFLSSKRSRTKAFTTRMADTFSWTLAFRSSYLRNTWLKMRRVTTMMAPMTTTRKARAMRKVRLSSTLMYMHMAKLKIRDRGERTAMRMTIIKACCTLVMSVVIRVTKPGTLNLSMLEKEKV